MQVGDRVGVVRKLDGTVHFFVNGIDQGACASNVPANVYGVIDLYGMAAQATIVDMSGKLVTEGVARYFVYSQIVNKPVAWLSHM